MTATIETTTRTVIVGPAGELRDLLTDAAVFASTDKSRPVLQGVCIERTETETVLVSTDTYVLAVRPISEYTDGPTGQWIITTDTIKSWAKMMDNRYATASIVIEDDTATLTVREATSSARLLTAEFPKWRTLWPADEDTGDAAAWGTTLLAKFAKLKTEKGRALRLTPHGQHKPATWKLGSFHGLLMPCRIS